MELILIAALVAVTVGHQVFLDRRDARAHQERESERRVMERLLQRIQAPEQAVVEHAAQTAQVQPPPVDSFDDEDYWKARENALERMADLERELNGRS